MIIYIDHCMHINSNIYIKIYMYLNINRKTNTNLRIINLWQIIILLRLEIIASIFISN